VLWVADTTTLPEVAPPVEKFEAEHVVAFVDDHDTVEDPPNATVFGESVRLAVGGGVTVMYTESTAVRAGVLPPPEHS